MQFSSCRKSNKGKAGLRFFTLFLLLFVSIHFVQFYAIVCATFENS